MAVQQRQQARRTRQAIVASAAREFDRNGYTATSVSTILEGSGTTKGAFYFHFPSKQSLAAAIVEVMHTRWAPAVQKWATSECDALGVVLGLVDELVVRTTSDTVVRAGLRLTTEHELAGAGFLAPFPEWERIFRHLFHRAAFTGLLRPEVQPQAAAHVLVTALVGERTWAPVGLGTEEMRRLTDQMLGLLVPALAVPEWTEQWLLSDWWTRTLPALAEDPDE